MPGNVELLFHLLFFVVFFNANVNLCFPNSDSRDTPITPSNSKTKFFCFFASAFNSTTPLDLFHEVPVNAVNASWSITAIPADK